LKVVLSWRKPESTTTPVNKKPATDHGLLFVK